MIQDKRRLQLYTALALSALVLCLGLLSASYAIDRLKSMLERKMAQDSEIIGENLRIFIKQVTQEYTDQDMALAQIQRILEILKKKKWIGFACVLDKNGRVLAHPRPELVGMQAPLNTYEPTALLGSLAPSVDSLAVLQNPGEASIYKTPSDIIAIHWLPQMMTYLCVHQSVEPLNDRVEQLGRLLALIGIGFVVVAAAGSWFFVGKLVDRYESHLEHSEARNRVLVQNSAPILVVDTSGALLDANPQAETLLGAPREALLQKNLKDLWLPDNHDQLEDLFRAVGPTDALERNDLDMLTSSGQTVPVDLRACRINYGDRYAIYLLLRDVTESRRAREEILEANRRLRELDQLKTDFLNTVSHELRTPLTSIKWSTESLATLVKVQDDENVQKLLGIIRDDNQRLSALIEQLLSFSRFDAGKLKPNFQTVDLAHFLQQALKEMAPIAQKRGITLSPHDSLKSLKLKADPEQLNQIFVNILDNAIKYTSRGGEVHLSSRSGEGWVEIDVKDTGIGIPEKDLPHIFEKFYRTDQPAARQERGTGLGLAIVKGIIDAHGGEIRIKSTPGSGTTFTIRLPQNGPRTKSPQDLTHSHAGQAPLLL